MLKKSLIALLVGAAVGCAADSEDDCEATRFAYSCFGQDVYVTACAKCDPVPNTPGVKLTPQCELRWANMSCVADVDGHRWAGSSTNRLDCTVDGGTGKSVRYNFELGSEPAVAYMTTSEGNQTSEPTADECREVGSN